MLFVPKVIVALLIIAFGTYFARFVANAVRTYCLGDGKPGATPEDRWMAAYADG